MIEIIQLEDGVESLEWYGLRSDVAVLIHTDKHFSLFFDVDKPGKWARYISNDFFVLGNGMMGTNFFGATEAGIEKLANMFEGLRCE